MKFEKRQISRSENTGGAYLKLADGESVNGVLRGEIFEFFQIWPHGGEKQIFDKPTAGAKSRFKVNFVVYEGGKFIAKVWEISLPTYIQLGDINEAYPLERTKVKITRRGSAKNTTYTILPLVNDPIPPAQLEVIAQVPLNMLERNDSPISGSEVPF